MMLTKTKINQEKFLEAFNEVKVVEWACKVANVSKTQVYQWRKQYPQFTYRMNNVRIDNYNHFRKELYKKDADHIEHLKHMKRSCRRSLEWD